MPQVMCFEPVERAVMGMLGFDPYEHFARWCELNGFYDMIRAEVDEFDTDQRNAAVEAYRQDYEGERQTLALDLMEV